MIVTLQPKPSILGRCVLNWGKIVLEMGKIHYKHSDRHLLSKYLIKLTNQKRWRRNGKRTQKVRQAKG